MLVQSFDPKIPLLCTVNQYFLENLFSIYLVWLFHDRHLLNNTPPNLINSALSIDWLFLWSLGSMSGISSLFIWHIENDKLYFHGLLEINQPFISSNSWSAMPNNACRFSCSRKRVMASASNMEKEGLVNLEDHLEDQKKWT